MGGNNLGSDQKGLGYIRGQEEKGRYCGGRELQREDSWVEFPK